MVASTSVTATASSLLSWNKWRDACPPPSTLRIWRWKMPHSCLFHCPLVSVLLINFSTPHSRKNQKHFTVGCILKVTGHRVNYELPYCICVAFSLLVSQQWTGHFGLWTFSVQFPRNGFPERFALSPVPKQKYMWSQDSKVFSECHFWAAVSPHALYSLPSSTVYPVNPHYFHPS